MRRWSWWGNDMYKTLVLGDSITYKNDFGDITGMVLYYIKKRKNAKAHEIKPAQDNIYIFKPKATGEYEVYLKYKDETQVLTIATVIKDRYKP